MTDINEKTSCSASDIYYRILQLGSEHTERGISLNELKKQLQTECLVSDPENTEHIEQWFSWSFEHKSFGCHCPTRETTNDCGCENDDPCSKYDHINNCSRYLNKTSIIEFSQLEQSHKLNEQIKLNKQQVDLLQNQLKITEQNAQDAKKESGWAFKLAIGSMGLAGISVFTDLASYKNHTNDKIQENTFQLKTIQETTSKQQIEINQKIYNLLDSLDNRISNDKKDYNIHLENIYKLLKTKPK